MTRPADYRPNCGPTAIAAIIDWGVDDVMEAYREQWRPGARWQGSSRLDKLIKTATRLGFTFREEQAGGTLERWIDRNAIPGRKYLIRTGGHFMALVDGKVIDQLGDDRLSELRRKRVTHAYFLKVAS